MLLPTDREIRALHEKYAPTQEAFDLVYTHCRIVHEIARQLLVPEVHDAELVRVGSLLHDIGVYRLHADDSYLRHGILGHELLRAEGFPEVICRFCSCHTGVGLTRDDVRKQGLPIPVADYLAETPEEELVMYADNFHSKSNPPAYVSADAYEARIRRFGDDKAAAFRSMREKYGVPDISKASRATPA
ncbi:HD domain-containing protein [Herbidospora mongoliensis]|uniref:HD domain-containing protein n=1 Tax=Herbidospora mongoliensis TaxID=688067 RepID=UPI000834BF32|nr:HD domain-containing protein [Herbidospora mongoliensis]